MGNATKHPGGRPRKYAEGPGRYSITLSPGDKELVEKFLLWTQFHLGKRMGVAEVLLEGVRGSPLFAEFKRATGYAPGRPPAGPPNLPLFTEPEPAVGAPAVDAPAEAKVQDAVEAIPEPTEPTPTREEQKPASTFFGAPFTAIHVPAEDKVLAMIRERRDAPVGAETVKTIAQGAGVDLTMIYRALKGARRLSSEARIKLAEYLKGRQ